MSLSLSDRSEELGGDTFGMVLGGCMEGGAWYLYSHATHTKKIRYEAARSTYNGFAPASDFDPIA